MKLIRTPVDHSVARSFPCQVWSVGGLLVRLCMQSVGGSAVRSCGRSVLRLFGRVVG